MNEENISYSKYFWELNEKALKETKQILQDPHHKKFNSRMVTLLSRCQNPKELYSIISKEDFIKFWPQVRKYWSKIEKSSSFRDWWETVYEQLLEKYKEREIKPKGRPAEFLVKVGNKIKEARKEKKLSQRDLAQRIGMKQPDISRIEDGKKNITLETLFRLSEVLDIKLVLEKSNNKRKE